MFDIIKDFLIKKGLESSLAEVLSVLSLIILSLIIGFALYFIVKKIILKFFAVIAKNSKTEWDDAIIRNKVFNRLALIIPALVLLVCPPFLRGDGYAGLLIPFIISHGSGI